MNKPVAYRHLHEDGWEYYDAPTGEDCEGCIPLYTHPVKELTCNSTEIANEKEFWESYEKVSSESHPAELTDEEIWKLWSETRLRLVYDRVQEFAKAILRKASEK